MKSKIGGKMTKICPQCKIEKNVKEFGKNKTRKDGYQHSCRKCRKIYIRNHYIKNKQSYLDRNKKIDIKIRKMITEIKIKSKCIECNENHPAVLDFHHINEKEKKFTISQWKPKGKGLLQILKEIKKCEVLCANCHRKLYYKLNGNGDGI